MITATATPNKKSNGESKSFFSLYLEYTADTECPTFFHRWTGLTCLSAMLGRNIYFRHGHFKLYPNLYTMLIGSPGTKKSTAIKMGERLMKLAGYNTFAAKKTRQEKFLLDMAEQQLETGDGSEILDENLWGEDEINYSSLPPTEVFIAADEFNNFIGISNIDFMSILGQLWDYEGVFDYKLKNSKSVFINEPAVTLLGGNTPTGMNLAFPTEAIGQGFFSRLIVVHAEPTGIKYTWMPPPDKKLEQELIVTLQYIRNTLIGEYTMSEEAAALFDKIYQSWEPIDDSRFESYANRRFAHHIKLILVISASHMHTRIEVSDVLEANTILAYTESLMSKALGEFGKSRNSDITHKIMQFLDKATEPVSFRMIWKHVHTDLDRRDQLQDIMANLYVADKVQQLEGSNYLPKKKVMEEKDSSLFNWDVLTDKERQLI